MISPLDNILGAAVAGKALTRDDARTLLPHLKTELLDIMAAARLSASAAGVASFTCGILNAKSGRCGEDCAYCAQSARHGGNAPVKPLCSEDDMLRRAEELAAHGVDYMGLVASGGGPLPAEFDQLCRAAGKITARVDIRLCASIGKLDEDQARRLKDAGFSRCHHNLETSREFFPSVCTTHTFAERTATVGNAKAAGLTVCSGGLFGMGETWEDRLSLSASVAELDADSIPVNFLIPIPGTPMGGRTALGPAEALAIIAVLRLMNPGRDIIVCGGRLGSLGDFAPLVLSAGANGLIVGDYLTRKGGAPAADFRYLEEMGQR